LRGRLLTRTSGCRKRRTWLHGDEQLEDDGRCVRRASDLKRRARKRCHFSAGATQRLRAKSETGSESGYQRKLLDQYETPAWVTLALIPHLPEFTDKGLGGSMRHPQDGRGATASWFRRGRERHHSGWGLPGSGTGDGVCAIITNPPYALARKFIELAMHFAATRMVAMLLWTDFGHATRVKTH
jgi:hypothetical protein